MSGRKESPSVHRRVEDSNVCYQWWCDILFQCMVFPICVYRTSGTPCTCTYMYMYVYICPYSNPEDLSLRHRLWLTSPSNQHTSVLLHHVHVYVYMTHREVRVVGVIGVIYRFLGFSLDVTVLLLLILQVYRHDHHMNNSTHMYINRDTVLLLNYCCHRKIVHCI